MKSFIFKDENNTKWRIWVRAWYQHKITSARKLKEFKQKSATANAKGKQ